MHNAAAETQDGDPTRCRFGRFWNVDLYLEKPPGGILSDGVSLHLQLFDFNLNSHTGHFDLKGLFEGGFLITKKADKNNSASEEDCLHECYEITMDFYKHIYDNSHTPICDGLTFDYENMKSVQVGPLWDNRFGWWTTFGLISNVDLNKRDNVFQT